MRRKCRSTLYCCHLFDHWRVWDVGRKGDLQTGWQGLLLLSCRTVQHPGRNTVGVRLSSRSRSDSRQLTAACCKSITCGILQPTRVTVSQPGLRPSWNHQLWDLSHLIDHFYRSPKACLAITEYSVFYSYVQIQISLCIWYVVQISNLS